MNASTFGYQLMSASSFKVNIPRANASGSFGCGVANDPRGAWTAAAIDFYVIGAADVVVQLGASSFVPTARFRIMQEENLGYNARLEFEAADFWERKSKSKRAYVFETFAEVEAAQREADAAAAAAAAAAPGEVEAHSGGAAAFGLFDWDE